MNAKKIKDFNETVIELNVVLDEIKKVGMPFIGKVICKSDGNLMKKITDKMSPIINNAANDGFSIIITPSKYSVYIEIWKYFDNEIMKLSHHLFDIADKKLIGIFDNKYYKTVEPYKVMLAKEKIRQLDKEYESKRKELEKQIPHILR